MNSGMQNVRSGSKSSLIFATVRCDKCTNYQSLLETVDPFSLISAIEGGMEGNEGSSLNFKECPLGECR